MVSLKPLTAIVMAVVIAGASYVAGYWPERGRRVDAEAAAAALQADLDVAQARVRTAALLGRVLMVRDLAARADYGQAQRASSEFFDAVRAETQTAASATYHQALTAVLANRDAVTTALAQADPGVVALLAPAERQLRVALEFPVPAAAVVPPAQ